MITITIERHRLTEGLDHLYTRLTAPDETLHINSVNFSSELKDPPAEVIEQVCYWLSQKLQPNT